MSRPRIHQPQGLAYLPDGDDHPQQVVLNSRRPAGALTEAAASTAHLELVGIGVRYGASLSWSVQDLHLTVGKGELFGLLGPSGCGKSSTLNVIAGFVQPMVGDVRVSGHSLAGISPHRRPTAMVFQSYALFPHLTVAENIAFGMRAHHRPANQIQRRTAELLSLVSLTTAAGRLPRQLSGGEQQRVALARALAVEPSILLLDEPLSNLDARLRRELRAELRKILRGIGVTAIFVTHDQSEALSLCDRVGIMLAGRLIQIDEPQRLYRRPASREVAEFLGESTILPVTVLERRHESAVVRLDLGSQWIGECAVTDHAPSSGRALLLLRPEHLRIGPSRGRATLPARVTDVDYLGATVDYLLELRGVPVRAKTLALAGRSQVGESVDISWDWNDGVVLPIDAPTEVPR